MKKTLLQIAESKQKETFDQIPIEEKLELLFKYWNGQLTTDQVIETIGEFYPNFTSINHLYVFMNQTMRYATRQNKIFTEQERELCFDEKQEVVALIRGFLKKHDGEFGDFFFRYRTLENNGFKIININQ